MKHAEGVPAVICWGARVVTTLEGPRYRCKLKSDAPCLYKPEDMPRCHGYCVELKIQTKEGDVNE